MLFGLEETTLTALVGLFGGLLLGFAARFGRFCTLGAIEDFFYGGKDTRLRMWAIAIGVATIGSFAAASLGGFDPAQSLYLRQSLNIWACIFGGLTFGYGMALAGNCGFGALARLGGGDLRSFVIVLVMGLSSYMTLSGPLARLRITVFPESQATGTPPGIAQLLSEASGISANTIGIAIGLVILAIGLASRRVFQKPAALFWGAVVGIAILSGWLGTYYLSHHGFEGLPVVSHTFSAPIGETMIYTMTSSGNLLSFGVGSVGGVLLGAFIGSLIKGHFRWEACEDPRELRRQIFGAALMGIGAVVAVGCSVGQGMSAFSVLALSAPITLAAIMAGAYLGLRQLIEGYARVA
ncbi:MAG: putative membrane protein YedE/YeeE [Halocynthiibacter sp.]|jgi:uncharacterized membrane protein YedE/YeeE